MLSGWRDVASRLGSSATNALLLDAPKKTAYGFVLGLFLYAAEIIAVRVLRVAPSVGAWELIAVGVFILHARPIWYHIVGRPGIGEKYEEQFEVIRRAELAGLSRLHVRAHLFELCRQALKETKLSIEARQELRALETENHDKGA